METPLDKALVGKQKNLPSHLKDAIEASPATMISTGVAGVDPMTGMPQANQLAPTAINPNALGSMQPQIPSVAGQQVSGSFDRVMPAPAQTGLAAPLNHDVKEEHMHPGEATGKIQEDKTSEYAVNMFTNDTLRPFGKKFNHFCSVLA